jgi:hypothetical protein
VAEIEDNGLPDRRRREQVARNALAHLCRPELGEADERHGNAVERTVGAHVCLRATQQPDEVDDPEDRGQASRCIGRVANWLASLLRVCRLNGLGVADDLRHSSIEIPSRHNDSRA